MREVLSVFLLYLKPNPLKALWILLRLCILPFNKLNRVIPKVGLIIDIGCGSGFLSQFLSQSSRKRQIIGIDKSKGRIRTAISTLAGKDSNVSFQLGDASKIHFPKANCFLLVDVLHHIPFSKQVSLLNSLSSRMKKDSLIIIKEVDSSNVLPFLFGQIIEKVLYPTETIYTRSKQDWVKLTSSLGLRSNPVREFFYFPDSTIILVCRKVKG